MDYFYDTGINITPGHKATVSWMSTVLSLSPGFASELCTVTQANCPTSLSWFPHPYCGAAYSCRLTGWPRQHNSNVTHFLISALVVDPRAIGDMLAVEGWGVSVMKKKRTNVTKP